jgi:ribose/xylose/arabinose/galactoside ABC-type transport system permease subunit
VLSAEEDRPRADAPAPRHDPAASATARKPADGLIRLVWQLLAPFVGLAIVLAFFQYKSPTTFLKPLNLKIVSAQTVYIALPAIGMTFVMIGGGIDLSVGSVMALCGVVTALAVKNHASPPLAMLAGIAVGGLIGLINGLLITSLRIIPFVVTLGMLGIARGLAKYLAGNQPIRVETLPDLLVDLTQPIRSPAWWDVAPSIWGMIAVACASAVLLNLTSFGRRTFALGSNETAARFSGIHINRQKWMLYTLGGLLTGLAGVLLFCNLTQGDPTAAVGIELQVIAAVVIGGGSLLGGEGSVLGTLIGAFMLTFLVNGCTLARYPNYVQEIVIGVIIILAVAIDYFRRRAPR